jgi:hypothetical protein
MSAHQSKDSAMNRAKFAAQRGQGRLVVVLARSARAMCLAGATRVPYARAFARAACPPLPFFLLNSDSGPR